MEIFGYEFRDAALLVEALTAPAYKIDKPNAKDNQRLEFLGDAVLGLLSARRVYDSFPAESEGPLTVRRIHMVSAAALCAAAERVGLRKQLRRNHGASELPVRSKTLADAVEAIIGAAYLDGGLDAAKVVFEALNLSDYATEDQWEGNPKGELQVRMQALVPPRHPEYEFVSVTGKSHEPVFTMKVRVDGVGEATASAGSRKAAETLAAAALLSDLASRAKPSSSN